MNSFEYRRFVLFAMTCSAFGTSLSKESVKNTSNKISFNVASSNCIKSINFLKTNGVKRFRISFADTGIFDVANPGKISEKSIKILREVVELLNNNDIYIIIDPHFFYGMINRYTTLPNDILWRNSLCLLYFKKIWIELADIFSDVDKKKIGFDVINEPTLNFGTIELSDAEPYVQYQVAATEALINIYNVSNVIIQPPAGYDKFGKRINRVSGLEYLKFHPKGSIVSVNYYLPENYTHQGVFDKKTIGSKYPGVYDNIIWNRDKIFHDIKYISDLVRSWGCSPIIGEFSVTCDAGVDSFSYLSDLIEACIFYNVDMYYHTFRESRFWDSEVKTCGYGGVSNDGNSGKNDDRFSMLMRY